MKTGRRRGRAEIIKCLLAEQAEKMRQLFLLDSGGVCSGLLFLYSICPVSFFVWICPFFSFLFPFSFCLSFFLSSFSFLRLVLFLEWLLFLVFFLLSRAVLALSFRLLCLLTQCGGARRDRDNRSKGQERQAPS